MMEGVWRINENLWRSKARRLVYLETDGRKEGAWISADQAGALEIVPGSDDCWIVHSWRGVDGGAHRVQLAPLAKKPVRLELCADSLILLVAGPRLRDTLFKMNKAGDGFFEPIAEARVEPVLENLLLLASSEIHRSESCSSFLENLTSAILVNLLDRYCARVPVPVSRGGLTRWQLELAIKRLSEIDEGQISLEKIAEDAGLSGSHFCRAFRQSTGHPPHHWLICHRVDRAKWELMQSRSPIAQIAVECGFSDQSHFTRHFTKIAGLSPAAFRSHANSSQQAFARAS